MSTALSENQDTNKKKKSFYNFRRLIDREYRCFHPEANVHIISDVDKTYLETKFASKTDLLKIAFESHEDKVTVHGASELMQILSASDLKIGGNLAIHFVSASPPQLRNTIEMKLSGDKVSWNSTTFKNQTYNLRKRRFHLLRNHVSYKCATILSLFQNSPENTEIYMIGDNAEKDAFIYFLVKLVLEKKITNEMFEDILINANTPRRTAQDIAREFAKTPKCKVKKIFIRNVPGHKTRVNKELVSDIHFFDHYLETALSLFSEERLSSLDVKTMIEKINNFRGDTYKELLVLVLRFMPLLSDEKIRDLHKVLGHHYITWPELKNSINSPFKRKTPSSFSSKEYHMAMNNWLDLFEVKT